MLLSKNVVTCFAVCKERQTWNGKQYDVSMPVPVGTNFKQNEFQFPTIMKPKLLTITLNLSNPIA